MLVRMVGCMVVVPYYEMPLGKPLGNASHDNNIWSRKFEYNVSIRLDDEWNHAYIVW